MVPSTLKPKTKLKLNKHADEFFGFETEKNRKERERRLLLNDPEYEFENDFDNRTRERRFRKVVRPPFEPKKPDPKLMKDDEEKRIIKEKVMF